MYRHQKDGIKMPVNPCQSGLMKDASKKIFLEYPITQTHTQIYIYIYHQVVLIAQGSLISFVHRSWQILLTAPCLHRTDLCKSLLIANTSVSMSSSTSVYVAYEFILPSSTCYKIAEGFRFMLLSLVRLKTFRLSTWVGWV